MPKMKTHRGAAARFKTTGSGKLRRLQQNNQHGFNKKSNNQKRRLNHEVALDNADAPRIKRLLGRR
jgi:large subunit ribosomal protein L35